MLKYFENLKNYSVVLVFHKTILRLQYVPENLYEVKKLGQNMAAFNALQRMESQIIHSFSIFWILEDLLFIYLFICVQELDFSTIPFHSFASISYVDFTTVAMQENFILLNPYPEEESRLTAIIRPINFTVGQRTKMTNNTIFSMFIK